MQDVIKQARRILESYDDALSDGMDHEEGFDYARDMRDIMLGLLDLIEQKGACDKKPSRNIEVRSDGHGISVVDDKAAGDINREAAKELVESGK
jgi:hypothetical protein